MGFKMNKIHTMVGNNYQDVSTGNYVSTTYNVDTGHSTSRSESGYSCGEENSETESEPHIMCKRKVFTKHKNIANCDNFGNNSDSEDYYDASDTAYNTGTDTEADQVQVSSYTDTVIGTAEENASRNNSEQVSCSTDTAQEKASRNNSEQVSCSTDTPGCNTKEEEEFVNLHTSATVHAELTSEEASYAMKQENSSRVTPEVWDPGGIMPVKYFTLEIGPHHRNEVMSMKMTLMIHTRLENKYVSIYEDSIVL